ncbi:unnamed protein product [Rhizopus stolonifer]
MILNQILNGYYETEFRITDNNKERCNNGILEIYQGCIYQITGPQYGVKAYKILSEYSFEIGDWCGHLSTFVYDVKEDRLVEMSTNKQKFIWRKIFTKDSTYVEVTK